MSLLRRCVLVMLVAWLVGGCAFLAGAAVAGAGVVYVKGEAHKRYPCDVPKVFDAGISTLENLGVITGDRLKGQESATIKGRTAGGEELTMRINQESRGITKVRLRVGLLGIRDYSQLVFSGMDRGLGL